MYTKFAEKFSKRVLLAPQTTASATEAYLAPTAGAMGAVIHCVAKMGNAADLVLSIKYADDASGTNATAFSFSSPIWVNNTRTTDAKTYTIGDATGNFVVEFAIDPASIPAGKFIGVGYANSNAANLLSCELIEGIGYSN
jgi:hypothetical protein